MRPHRRTGYQITDQQWQRIAHLLPGKIGDVGHAAADNRLFINRTAEAAVLWIARSGAPWRDLPERFELWNSNYQRFRRWAKADVWRKVFEELQEPDLDWLMIDSTVVRAHQHASGQKKRSCQRMLSRADFYGSNKRARISFVIFFAPLDHRINPMNQLVS